MINSVVVIGRLPRDPEVVKRDEKGDPSVVNFTVAVNRPKKQGEDQGADFIRIVVFGAQAANCDKYLSKGRQVGISGRINTGSYTNKEGQKVYTTDVVADRVEFLGSSGSGQKMAETTAEPVQQTAESAVDDAAADVPF